MSGMILLETKRSTETKRYSFDFLSQLAPGETLLAGSCTVSVWSGVDSSPQSIRSGSPTISGSIVNQKFTAGVVGVIYSVVVSAITSQSQTLTLQGYLAISNDPLSGVAPGSSQ